MSEQENSEWIELVVEASVSMAETLAAELVDRIDAAAGGVAIRKSELVFWVRPNELEEVLASTRELLGSLKEAGWALEDVEVFAGREAPEQEWRDAWKKHFHVTRLTRQIVVVPSWEKYEALATDLLIDLDPGQAFGTGAHASTQLVLSEMQSLADGDFPKPRRVFDLGTGSGILAIAALKFWPDCTVRATDIDALAVSATVENAEKNGVGGKIAVSTDSLKEVEECFPLVLANIQAHILRDLRDELLPKLEVGGTLILSGILSAQIDSLTEYFCASGHLELLRVNRSELNPDWSSAVVRKIR